MTTTYPHLDQICEALIQKAMSDEAREHYARLGSQYDWEPRAIRTIEESLPHIIDISEYMIYDPKRWNRQFMPYMPGYSDDLNKLIKAAPNQYITLKFGEELVKHAGLKENLATNRNPDYLRRSLSYDNLSMYKKTKKKERNPNQEVFPFAEGGELDVEDVELLSLDGKPYRFGRGVANVPDGCECKTCRDTITINAHAKNAGLHLAKTYTFDDDGRVRITGTFAAFALPSDYTETERNSQGTTVKFVLNPDGFNCLQTGRPYREELERYMGKGLSGPIANSLF